MKKLRLINEVPILTIISTFSIPPFRWLYIHVSYDVSWIIRQPQEALKDNIIFYTYTALPNTLQAG